MARGLLWLPLLLVFIWLTWSGWNEYQKLEAYKIWAKDFDNAKFDIYAVLGKKNRNIIWGKPTRKGMVELQNFSLDDVEKIELLVGDRSYDRAALEAVEIDDLPTKGKTALEFHFIDRHPTLQIPFTDVSLAAKWCAYLQS
jgi:hypothetical protein